MKETELWELLVSLSANEISLAETHDRIMCLFGVSELACELCNGTKIFKAIDMELPCPCTIKTGHNDKHHSKK